MKQTKCLIIFLILCFYFGQALAALPWSYTNTGISHTIVIPTTANPNIGGVPLTNGDYIGVFYDSSGTLKCAGYEMWTGNTNIAVSAFGDDAMTPGKDGFANNEVFQWKVWYHQSEAAFEAWATYEPIGGIVTNTDRYSTNGISRINSGPLPVQISSFLSSMVEGNNVKLEWSTISEMNNYGFYVERRKENEINFTEIENSFTPGNGTTLEPQSYLFIDKTLIATGMYYYRLRQVDNDGLVHYSQEVSISVTALGVNETAPIEFKVHQNYPNPTNPKTIIKFSVDKVEHATVVVYDILGKEVAKLFDGVVQPGRYYNIEFDGSSLSSGIYFYKVTTESHSELKKLVLMK
jgi:hypothetical protein